MNPNPNTSQTRREGRLVPTPPAVPCPPRPNVIVTAAVAGLFGLATIGVFIAAAVVIL